MKKRIFEAGRWQKLWEKASVSGIVRWRQAVYLAQDLAPVKRDADPLAETRPVRLSLRQEYDLAIQGRIHYPNVAYHLICLWHNWKQWLR